MLAQNPQTIDTLVAQPENWRFPAAGLPPVPGGVESSNGSSGGRATTSSASTNPSDAEADVPPTTLKFYQPAHARFYLVSASLACRLPGLPDHTIKRNQGETTTFVVRKLQLKNSVKTPPSGPPDLQDYDEYAWLPNATPPGWLQLSDPATLAPGEEQLPLFNVQFGSSGKQKRLYAGMIPVGKRQTYVSARALQQNGATPQPLTVDDPRKLEFQRQVLDPWADLVAWASKLDQASKANWIHTTAALPPDEFAAAQGSAYILIDFGKYLAANLPQVWAAVTDPTQVALTGAQLALYNAFSATMADAKDTSQTTLAQALLMASKAASAFEAETLATGQHLDLPDQYVGPLLTDSQLNALIGRPDDESFLTQRPIETLIENALNQQGTAPQGVIPPPTKDPQNPLGDDWFIIRCLYQRPLCAVRTIPAPIVFSPPTQLFQLASFFDPDAPARRIQVALPVDTTPAALRKYDKGVAFMISDQLNQQMQRVRGLKALMNGTIDDPSGFGLGMICSFSIPIITICALIVLFIFVILLNIVFFWLPFLKICFPLPSFKAKG